MDFIQYSAEVTKVINKWVSVNTNDKIKEIVKEEDLLQSTRVALINALYFDVKWKFQFRKEQKFYLDESHQKDVSMMHQVNHFNYFKGDKYAGLVMPYQGNKFEMVVILPDSKTGLKEVMSEFNGDCLSKLRADARESYVSLSLPKFKIEQEINAIPILESMGMKEGLSKAGFDSIVKGNNLLISKIVQKVVIEVDEEGTKAAAALQVALSDSAKSSDVEFKVDHPFGYFLVHSESDAILFMGHYIK